MLDQIAGSIGFTDYFGAAGNLYVIHDFVFSGYICAFGGVYTYTHDITVKIIQIDLIYFLIYTIDGSAEVRKIRQGYGFQV